MNVKPATLYRISNTDTDQSTDAIRSNHPITPTQNMNQMLVTINVRCKRTRPKNETKDDDSIVVQMTMMTAVIRMTSTTAGMMTIIIVLLLRRAIIISGGES